MLVICLLVYFCIDQSPFFVQKRSGRYHESFEIYKFRTLPFKMKTFDNYRNPVSLFLRRSGLDELPQLFNVLKADMSLVGPRPLLPEYEEDYSDYQKKRFDVTPGVTGLAQIKGFNRLSWAHRFRYDVFYAQRRSFLLDAYILMRTIVIFVTFKRFSEAEPHYSGKFGKQD